MTLQEQYEFETGKRAYEYGGIPKRDYVEWLEQFHRSSHQDTVVIFDTYEKIEEGALLLARIKNVDELQLTSDQVKRMNYLIKKTGFELHHKK